jgi:hypothetical protein
LATMLGITVRAVQRNLAALAERGHLAVTVTRGRHNPNVYRLILKKTTPASSFNPGKHDASDVLSTAENTTPASPLRGEKHDASDHKTRRWRQQNTTPASYRTIETTIEEPLRGRSRASPRANRTRFPESFMLDDVGKQYAAKHGFSTTDAERMFQRFRDHHLAKGSTFADWPAAWRTWVNREVEFKRANESATQFPGGLPYDPGM